VVRRDPGDHDFVSLELAIEQFLRRRLAPRIEAACLGVAGPVVDGRCQATNLPWVSTSGC